MWNCDAFYLCFIIYDDLFFHLSLSQQNQDTLSPFNGTLFIHIWWNTVEVSSAHALSWPIRKTTKFSKRWPYMCVVGIRSDLKWSNQSFLNWILDSSLRKKVFYWCSRCGYFCWFSTNCGFPTKTVKRNSLTSRLLSLSVFLLQSLNLLLCWFYFRMWAVKGVKISDQFDQTKLSFLSDTLRHVCCMQAIYYVYHNVWFWFFNWIEKQLNSNCMENYGSISVAGKTDDYGKCVNFEYLTSF